MAARDGGNPGGRSSGPGGRGGRTGGRGTGSRGPGGAGGRQSRGGRGPQMGKSAGSRSRVRDIGGKRNPPKAPATQPFTGRSKKAGETKIVPLKMVAFDEAIAAAQKKANEATTAAAKAAAAKALAAAKAAKAAAIAKAAADKAAANKREQARTKSGRDRAVANAGKGGSSVGKGAGNKQGQTRGGPGKGRSSAGSTSGSRGPGGRGGRSSSGRGGRGGGGGGGGGNSGGGRGGCFIAETLVQMLDGTTKPIIDIQVGEHTKGGIVESKMEFLPTSIYNYKDVQVSGSHWVIEDNQFTEVENSKHGILTDKIETVYCFKTSENRIWVNNIEFGDYESGSQKDWEPHFEQVKQKLNKELLNNKNI